MAEGLTFASSACAADGAEPTQPFCQQAEVDAGGDPGRGDQVAVVDQPLVAVGGPEAVQGRTAVQCEVAGRPGRPREMDLRAHEVAALGATMNG